MSFNAATWRSLCEPLWSFFVYFLPPNTTIIPNADPYSQMAAAWYTLGHGITLFWNSYFCHEKGPFNIFSNHTSFSALFPELPPKTTRYGLLKSIVCPYLCPGVHALLVTSIIFHTGLNNYTFTLFSNPRYTAHPWVNLDFLKQRHRR